MLKKLAIGLIAGTGVFATVLAPAAQASSGLPGKSQWESDVNAVAKPLMSYVQQRLAGSKPGDHLALVLDIDNTSLASHYDPGKPVKPVLAVTQYAHQHGAAILFATYRSDSSRRSTTMELHNAGYTVDGLCMKTKSGAGKADVKLSCRESFEKQGYTLVANIGNNDTDFKGGHYEKGFELPNYGGALS
ncbi:HAD family acid phosphatase [Kitasatospora sp. NPDC001175]|uniref:HAD family acid phosphatase n=1 Tax=Kitasatospora sp. NPDC001175 TaxID=3157103 RepID=UPI003D00ADF7